MVTGRLGESRWVGIDLGTANSVVAYVDHAGIPNSIVNFEGEVATPSKLLIEEQSVLVGREAGKIGRQHSDKFAESFKRYMGEGQYPRPVDGRSWRPELLSALVLRRLKRDTESRLGEVAGAVITVPAYFDEARRRATCAAAEVAGWNVIDLINEPTAAALAYAYHAGRLGACAGADERILVFDLGGGTMDVTLLQITHGEEYRTLATDGEVQLGGVDWDTRLRDYLADQFHQQTGVDPLATRQGEVEFMQLAETAKIALSQRETAKVPCVFGSHRLVLKATRQTFEELTRDLLDRTRGTVELVIEQAGIGWPDVNTLLTVGGSTRMPMIHQMLETLAGKRPQQDLSVDEAIAHGAALYANLLRPHEGRKGVRVVNVNSLSYRVIAKPRGKELVAHPLIRKNTPLPAVGRHVFRTKPGQKDCSIVICDGESADPRDCALIGKVVVEGLPPSGTGHWLVNVRLVCRQDGKLDVDATVHDPQNHAHVVKRATATIVPTHGMNADEVQRARALVEMMEIT